MIEIGNEWAVLVGINKYVDPVIADLSFCVNDIDEFYKVLVDPERGKYNENNVKILSDLHDEKPTRNNILSKLTAMCRSASPEDSILFYFSGHGYEEKEEPYLLCSDSYANPLRETAIPTNLIRKMMEDSLARVKIVILDGCHSGSIKGIKDAGIMTKNLFEIFIPPPEGFVVLTSCKLGEWSYEFPEMSHGLFSYFLLEGLQGGADKDGDRIITITEAHGYTSENVKRWAFQKGLEQNPTLEARISGDIPLVHVEKILEKEERIDKNVVEEISLASNLGLYSSVGLAEELCGRLLKFFKTSEIEKVSGREYKFPYGTLNPTSKLVDRERKSQVIASFEYSKENWSRIDEIIGFFDGEYSWESIEFRVKKRMNIERLVEKCKESGLEIVSFNPKKGEESIKVNTKAWLGTETVFRNRESCSEIHISTQRFSLETNFYSTLSPENVLEFVKDCLE